VGMVEVGATRIERRARGRNLPSEEALVILRTTGEGPEESEGTRDCQRRSPVAHSNEPLRQAILGTEVPGFCGPSSFELEEIS